MPFIITDEKRQERRVYLVNRGFTALLHQEVLKDHSKEFGELPFTLRDLYEIHLCDQLKMYPFGCSISISETDLMKANALACAKLVMIGYVARNK